MSLLKKASIITTPTAYAEDFLYNIKPAGGLGNELITNGTFDTDSNWTKGTGWSIANGKATVTSSITDSIYQDALTLGKTFKVTFEITNITSGSLRVGIGINFSDYFTEVGTYTFYGQPSNDTLLRINPSSGTNASIDNVSVKEVADFDFTRNSTGTRLNEDYLIEDVPYNLLTYSEDFSNSGWTKTGNTTVSLNDTNAPNNTLTASTISGLTGSGSNDLFNLTGLNPANQTFTFSVYLKGQGTLRMQMSNNVNQGAQQIVTLTSQWKRHTLTATFNSTSGNLSATLDDSGATATTYKLWGAQLVKGDQPKDYLKTTDRLDIPRIDYTNGEPSILLEPSRTNLVTYSQDFTQWGNARTTDTANQITSPDGLNNGTLLEQQSGQTNAGSIFLNVSLASGTYTQSIYAKKKDKNFIVGYDANAARTYFNLETGKVATVASGVTAEMIAMPNDWYRCIITYTITTGAVIAFYLADNDNSSTVTDSGGVYIYGAQVEAGSYPTSLIHTSGSAVTRSADLANNAGNSDVINSTEGVLYAEISSFDNSGDYRLISLSDGTVNNRIFIGFRLNTGYIYYYVIAGGVSQSNFDTTITSANSFSKIALKYKANDFALWVNGVEIYADSSGSIVSGLDTLQFANGNGTQFPFYGNAKMVAVFKEALTDTELACLTGYNNHELYMNYYNRLSYLGLVEEYNVESDINNYIL